MDHNYLPTTVQGVFCTPHLVQKAVERSNNHHSVPAVRGQGRVIYAPEVQPCSDSGVPYRRCMPVVGAGVG